MFAVAACGGGSPSKTAKKPKTTSTRSAASTTTPAAVFNVSVFDYVLRFNNTRKFAREVLGETLAYDLRAEPVAAGVFGSGVNRNNSVYVVATATSGKVEAAIVTAPLENGSGTTPARLLSVACTGLLDMTTGLTNAIEAAEAFNEDAVPKLGSVRSSTVIAVGGLYDIRIVAVGSSGVGFVCVPPGSPVSDAARRLPA